MKKSLCFCIAALCLLWACKPDPIIDPDDPNDNPQKVDTILNYDTIFVDTVRIDTIGCDTIQNISYTPIDNNKIVLAYYPYYTSARMPNPEYITHANYGFAELYMVDSVYSKFGLQGNISKFKSFVALKKQNPNIKLLLSFTHTISNSDNKQGGGFAVLAADPEQRKHFAEDCLAFCQEWGLDGIDIDWEFPTVSWSGHHCTPNDTKNFTLLMKDLRATLGNDYLLTYAAYCMCNKYIDDNAVEPYVDYINVMCYDMCSAPQPHNAMSCSGYWDINRTYRSFVNANYKMSKFVLGIPFYGRHTFEDGEWYFWKLNGYVTSKTMSSIWQEHWSDTWKVPYVTKNGQFWCSYENPRSIEYKGNWVNENSLGGLMYWESSGDDSKYTLAQATWHAMKSIKNVDEEYNYILDTIQIRDTIIKCDTIFVEL